MSFIQGIINNQVFSTPSKPLVVDNSHIFADATARDSYFVANPSELMDGMYIQIGDGFQNYVNSAWNDVSAIMRGKGFLLLEMLDKF